MSKQPTKNKAVQSGEATPHTVRRLKTPPKVWYQPNTWFYRQIERRGALPKARQLFVASWNMLVSAKKQVFTLYMVYIVGLLVFAQAIASATDLASIKSLLDGVVTGATGKLQITSLQLTYLYSSSGSAAGNANAGLYQTILLLICSLALVWLFRQTLAGNTVTIKQAFYRGMYPIVQVVLVLLLFAVQLLPLALGSYVYATLVSNRIIVSFGEHLVVILIFVGLAWWSLRMITATMFALYIVTLPDMEPMQSVRNANQLVAERRLVVLRKIVPLPIVLFLVTSAIVVPFLFVSSFLAVWVFFALSGAWFIYTNAYLYTLYRELLNNE